jgi:DNA-binding MarR family transcriptional regulator
MTDKPPADHVDRLRAQWKRELPDLDTEAIEVVGRARRITLALRPDIEAVFARHGLDAGEFDVIGSLRRSGPPYRLRPTELYRALMISSGGLTDRLARLEARGLVKREPSPEDRRSLMVELTAEGRAKAEAALREDMAVETAKLAGLTAGERKQLAGLLRKLAVSLEQAGPSAGEQA